MASRATGSASPIARLRSGLLNVIPETYPICYRRGRLTLRITVGVLAAALSVLVWRQRNAYRGLEAGTAGWVSQALIGGREFTVRSSSTFFLNVGTPKVFGLVVTPECTSAVVTAVILAVTALAVVATRFTFRRTLLAALSATAAFAAVNIARLVLIAVASDKGGLRSGYHWSHIWAGTFVTLFGGVGVAALYLVVLGGGRLPRGRRLGPSGQA